MASVPSLTTTSSSSSTPSSSSAFPFLSTFPSSSLVPLGSVANSAEDPLKRLISHLPMQLQETLQPFEESYNSAVAAVAPTQEQFVLITGAAGTGKSSVIGAVTGKFEIVPSSGATKSLTMVPTRIKRHQQGCSDETFTMRIVHSVHTKQWEDTRRKALKRLQDSIAGMIGDDDEDGDDETSTSEYTARQTSNFAAITKLPDPSPSATARSQKAPIQRLLEDSSTLNVLRSTYPICNPNCYALFDWAVNTIPGVITFASDRATGPTTASTDLLVAEQRTDSAWQVSAAQHIVSTWLAQMQVQDQSAQTMDDVLGVNQLSMHTEQLFVGLNEEEVNLLLRLVSLNHQSSSAIIQLLVCRHILNASEMTDNQFRAMKRSALSHLRADREFVQQEQSVKRMQEEKLLESCRAALSLRQTLHDSHQRPLRFPSDLLNLWPLIDFVEICGPVDLPNGVVLVDTAGSQDGNQLFNPIETAKKSLYPGKAARVWYLVSSSRMEARDSTYAEVPLLNDLFPWNSVRYVFTKYDEVDEPDMMLKSTVKREIGDKLERIDIQIRERANDVQIHTVSSLAYMALRDPTRFEGRIAATSLQRYKLAISATASEIDDLMSDDQDSLIERGTAEVSPEDRTEIPLLKADLLAVKETLDRLLETTQRNFAEQLYHQLTFIRRINIWRASSYLIVPSTILCNDNTSTSDTEDDLDEADDYSSQVAIGLFDPAHNSSEREKEERGDQKQLSHDVEDTVTAEALDLTPSPPRTLLDIRHALSSARNQFRCGLARSVGQILSEHNQHAIPPTCSDKQLFDFGQNLFLVLRNQLAQLTHHTQLTALVKSQGELDTCRRSKNGKGKQFRFAQMLGVQFEASFSATLLGVALSDLLITAAQTHLNAFYVKVKAIVAERHASLRVILESLSRDDSSDPSYSLSGAGSGVSVDFSGPLANVHALHDEWLRLERLSQLCNSLPDLDGHTLASKLASLSPSTMSYALEHRGDLREPYLDMWQSVDEALKNAHAAGCKTLGPRIKVTLDKLESGVPPVLRTIFLALLREHAGLICEAVRREVQRLADDVKQQLELTLSTSSSAPLEQEHYERAVEELIHINPFIRDIHLNGQTQVPHERILLQLLRQSKAINTGHVDYAVHIPSSTATVVGSKRKRVSSELGADNSTAMPAANNEGRVRILRRPFQGPVFASVQLGGGLCYRAAVNAVVFASSQRMSA